MFATPAGNAMVRDAGRGRTEIGIVGGKGRERPVAGKHGATDEIPYAVRHGVVEIIERGLDPW